MADARVGEAVSFMQVRVDVSGPGAELVLKQVTLETANWWQANETAVLKDGYTLIDYITGRNGRQRRSLVVRPPPPEHRIFHPDYEFTAQEGFYGHCRGIFADTCCVQMKAGNITLQVPAKDLQQSRQFSTHHDRGHHVSAQPAPVLAIWRPQRGVYSGQMQTKLDIRDESDLAGLLKTATVTATRYPGFTFITGIRFGTWVLPAEMLCDSKPQAMGCRFIYPSSDQS